MSDVLPGVRFAVDAYVNFARRAPWQEAVCSSLTELFAPEIHKQRLANWPEHYPWIDQAGLHYFRSRVLARAARCGAWSGDHARVTSGRAEQQQRALEMLKFKLDVLWAMSDAMAQHYGVQLHHDQLVIEAFVDRRIRSARLSPAMGSGAERHVLLYPEGMVKLNAAPARF